MRDELDWAAMEQRTFGWTGEAVPALGQGTWKMEHRRAGAVAALRAGIDAGMTHIDTAEMYGSGAVERLVGQAIAGRRHDLFLVSKVLPTNASRAGTIAACEASLRALGTDHLDLYLLHWPGSHPLEQTFAAFEQLQSAGKICFYGVSNFDEHEIEQALAVAGEGRIACNQVLYHLEERHIEHAVLPVCARHDIAVVAYSPFGSGAFPTGRGGAARGSSRPAGALRAEAAARLRQIAAHHEATPRQVALRFLLRHPGTFVIPKAARVDHVLENAGADRVQLSDEEIRAIEAAFPLGRPRRHLPMI
jgi:diketogulonate reductase-like aldo/keto reductase